MTRAVLSVLALVLVPCGCGSDGEDSPAPVWVLVRAAAGSRLDPSGARLDPSPEIVAATRTAPDAWALALDSGHLPPTTTVRVPGACPAEVSLDPGTVGPGGHVEVVVRPLLRVEPAAQVGYDAPFRVEVLPGCRDAVAGGITWEQVAGDPAEVTSERNGFVLRGRTPTFEQAHGGPVPWGVVPASPRTRGQLVFRGTWRSGAAAPVTVEASVAAVPRATGLPSVPLGGRVLLGGEGWHVTERPRGARAEVEPAGAVHALTVDAKGTFLLEDADGRELSLRVGRYDETTLDCGRTECHASAAEHASTTIMTSVLARGLEGGLAEGYDPACALGCHTVGEPGLPDGGFSHVVREGGFAVPRGPSLGAWDRLPVPLRRLGGVGCLACHGPGAIPAPESRWAILRSDVCAVCHDAPPRYGHVEAWRGSAMARADADARVRQDAGCAGCHTTSGFLARVGIRAAQPLPEGVGPLGVGCAACHAPHGDHVDLALLRRVDPPPSVADAAALPEASLVCVSCHSPLDDGRPPAGAAAAIWLGTGGLAPQDGSPLALDAVHADVEKGCAGCHAAGPEELERGAGHRFTVTEAQCAPCHDEGDVLTGARATTEELHRRARSLRDRLVSAGALRIASTRAEDPLHAGGTAIAEPDSPLGRAAWDVLLVLEDGAAGAHGPTVAAALLDAAEAAMP